MRMGEDLKVLHAPRQVIDANMSLSLVRVEAALVRTKISTPVRTSFGVMNDRPTLIVRVTDQSGARGYGEVWCNFPVCGASHRLKLIETELAPRLEGKAFASPADCFAAMKDGLRILRLQTGEPGPVAQIVAGVDIAIWDMLARRAALPVYALLGSERNEIPAYASGINPIGVLDTVAAARARGHRTFKVKVGFGNETDRENVRALASDMGPDEAFMLDANQGWSPVEARAAMEWISPFRPLWIEEPMPVDVPEADWFALKSSTNVPIAGAENFLTGADYEAVIARKWLDVVQPDIAKWGGFTGCTPVARGVVAAGLNYCPHSLGGGVALAASAHLLAAAGGPGRLECDANENAFRDEVFDLPLNEGIVTLSDGPGLGIDTAVLDAAFG
ncbi:MAG: mandelate racemase/muconate lactonizing enzyme family protein [Pseudomonadota bacterium]